MNKKRLKELLKLKTDLEKIRDDFQGLQDEEQEAFDNLPESFQMGEQGIELEENVEFLAEVNENIDQALMSLENFDFELIKSKGNRSTAHHD